MAGTYVNNSWSLQNKTVAQIEWRDTSIEGMWYHAICYLSYQMQDISSLKNIMYNIGFFSENLILAILLSWNFNHTKTWVHTIWSWRSIKQQKKSPVYVDNACHWGEENIKFITPRNCLGYNLSQLEITIYIVIFSQFALSCTWWA